MTSPTKDTLLDFLHSLDPIPDALINQFKKNPTATMSIWMARTKAQWKEIAGIPNGIDIYNHLRSFGRMNLFGILPGMQPTQHDDDVLVASEEIVGLDLEFASSLPHHVGSFFSVHGLFHAGLSKSDRDGTRLYCREDTLALLNALTVMKKGIRISGPSGIGKSVTTWLWACHQVYVHKKTVLWVHVAKDSAYQVLLISGHKVHSAVVLEIQIPSFIESNLSDIVIIDGVTRDSGLDLYMKVVFNWKFNHARFAVSVASIARKTNDEDDERIGVSLFDALPWSFDEYVAAIDNNDFFEQVESMLLQTTQNAIGAQRTRDDRVELLNNKFYYAGHSARWMWATSLSLVMDKLARS